LGLDTSFRFWGGIQTSLPPKLVSQGSTLEVSTPETDPTKTLPVLPEEEPSLLQVSITSFKFPSQAGSRVPKKSAKDRGEKTGPKVIVGVDTEGEVSTHFPAENLSHIMTERKKSWAKCF
jgi:hypothetical protein